MIANEARVVTQLSASALDQIPLGVVRISTDERIVYMNRAARVLMSGVKEGASLSELRLEAASRDTLATQLDQRFDAGRGARYELTVDDAAAGIHRRLEVCAVPEVDGEGAPTGSIGFIRDRSEEVANMALHAGIQEARTWQQLLKRVAYELRKVISHHSFMVTLVSANEQHLRQLVEEPPSDQAPSPFKWWPMPALVKEMIKELRTDAESVDVMFRRSPYKELAETDKPTQDWLARKFKHLLRRPIYRGDRLVAFAVLQRKEDVPFTAAEVAMFDALPIAEAVNIAIVFDRKGEMQFWLDLVRELGQRADEPEALRSHLVSRLQENYCWDHVSLFRVDYDQHVFRLLSQTARDLPAGHTRDLDEGWLAEARKSGKPVVVDDVKERPERYVRALPDAASEMCVPIPGAPLRWILNVESKLKNAFADEEVSSVEFVLSMAGFLLDRAATAELKSSIFGAVADAVFLTASKGTIEEVNPAALRMLEMPLADVIGRNLADFIATPDNPDDRSFGRFLVQENTLRMKPAALRRASGPPAAVLLSASTLDNEEGSRVYIATDSTQLDRAREMDHLKRIFSQVAAETRIPIALACTFLRDVPLQGADAYDLADRALAQLRKADLPLERILRLASRDDDHPLQRRAVDVPQVIASILADLPRRQAEQVQVHEHSRRSAANAARGELAFCLHCIIALMLRQKAQDDQARIDVACTDAGVAIDMRLERRDTGRNETAVTWAEDQVRAFVFPEDVIRSLLARMGGSLDASESDKLQFRIQLEAAEQAHVHTLATVGA